MGASQLRVSTLPPPQDSTGRGSRTRHARVARDVAPYALAAVLVLAPQALGGIYPLAMVSTAVAAGLTLALVLVSARSGDMPSPWFLAIALGPLALTALQVIPLPIAWVSATSPLSAQRLAETHELLGMAPPTSAVLSRDPASTREELVKVWALACTMLSAAMLAARGEQRIVFGAAAGSALLMGVVALGHAAVGAELVFGVYHPIDVRDLPLLAPLLNPNNLGGFLAMGVPLMIGFALEHRMPRMRVLLLVAMGALAATALMTRSRGAAGAVALGPALYAILALIRTRGQGTGRPIRAPRWWRAATPIGIATVIAMAGFAWYDELAVEFERSGWDKLDLIAMGARFALDSPLVGVGRGAFSAALVGSMPSAYRFDYAENMIVQWAADWGVPFALLFVAGLAALLVRAARRARSHARIGAVAAVATLAAQNLVDLGLELLGPALVATALLGACASFPGNARRALSAWGALGAVVALGAVIVPIALASRLIDEHGPAVKQRLSILLEQRDHDAFTALLDRALLAHPSEPMLAILGAHAALRAGAANAGLFINRGMVLAPGWSAPHVQAAQWLWNRNLRRQALLELRAAAERELVAPMALACAMAAHDPDGVVDAGAPKAPQQRAAFLERLANCLPADSETLLRVDAELIETAPRLADPHVRLARRALRAGRFAEAAEAAEVALGHKPGHPAAIALAADAHSKAGDFRAAYVVLDKGLKAGASPTVIYTRRARVAALAKDRETLHESLSWLRGWVGADAEALDSVYCLEGELLHGLGDLGAALLAYQEAHKLTASPRSLEGVAKVAEALGDSRRALRAYTELCEIGGNVGAACKRRDVLRNRRVSP